MQQLIEKAIALNAQRRRAEEDKKAALQDKQYRDIEIALRAVLGDDAQPILDNAEHYQTHNSMCLASGDWIFKESGYYSQKIQCAVVHVKALESDVHISWDTFSDLAEFGACIEAQLKNLRRREEVKARLAERNAQMRAQSPHLPALAPLKRIVFDIQDNEKLSPGQELIAALAFWLYYEEHIDDYDVESDLEDYSEEDDIPL